MDTKCCSKCNTVYPLSNFYKHKNNSCGYRPQCKSCFSTLNSRVWHSTRRIQREENRKNKIQLSPEEKKEKEKARRRIANRGPEYALAQKLWRQKYYADPQRNLARAIRRRLYMAYKSKSKTGKTLDYLGCSWAELKLHLETQFQPGMTWENHGVNGWHIDHIIPLCAVDLENEEEVKKVCHYKNLRPLWAHENIAKIQQDIKEKQKCH